ncbi:glycosyltransferase [Winogradskyella sp. PE311]|uniref:glycosyltransferase n=1 Tax=Winogradskyella sp. PE311 TaxID=3366943 RepID=UPI00397FA7A0
MKTIHTIIAYACEDAGSEPSVGYHWSKYIAQLKPANNITVITRKNNDISLLIENYNINKIEIDLPSNLIFIKKIIGIRLYYLIWKFLVFIHLIKNFSRYKQGIVHHITFTPIYYPPIYFCLPFKFNWGPIGGGESYPLAYYKSMMLADVINEIFRSILKYSIYINPLFYFGCYRSSLIISSTEETTQLIPKLYRKKVVTELMVIDNDKNDLVDIGNQTIIIANRLINWKMTHLFVDAFDAFLQISDTQYKLIIIGDGKYFSKIKPYIDSKNINHYSRFKDRNDMLDALKKSSLFVSMSLRDSGAASLLEAISYGIPYLVTNSGAHKLFLNNGVGYSFKPSNYEADKAKIIKILSCVLNDNAVLQSERDKVRALYTSVFSEKVKKERLSNFF